MAAGFQLPLIKALYFVQCVAGCCISNFIVVFLKYRGLDYRQIGVIFGGIYPFSQLFAQPIWCWIADVSGFPKAIMLFSLVVGSSLIFCVQYYSHFVEIAAVLGAGAVANAAVNPMLDSATIAIFSRYGVDLEAYGKYRVYGALGWGISATAIGIMIQHLNVFWLFYDYAIASFFFGCLLYLLEMDALKQKADAESHGNHDEETALLGGEHANKTEKQALTFGQFLSAMFSKPGVPLFFSLVAIMGIAKGAVDAFLFAFLQDMGASTTLLGLTLSMTTVSGLLFSTLNQNLTLVL